MSKIKPGEKAPDFEFNALDGTTKKLSDLRGEKIILYFYPKDNTPGCTAQACNLTEDYSILQKAGVQVIGVSADSEKRHQNFREKYNLPFPLVADTEKEVIGKYGVWGEKKFMGKVYDGILRTTFIIDEQGKVAHVIDKVKTKTHTDQINELINYKKH